jgi:hypothetical protein
MASVGEALLRASGVCRCWARTREANSFLWFCRHCVYPVKHTGLLTLELLITL